MKPLLRRITTLMHKVFVNKNNVDYMAVHNEEELKSLLPQFVSHCGDRPILLEVFTNQQQDTEALKTYYQTIAQLSTKK